MFRQIGNWKEATELFEASLLLNPNQPDVHGQLVWVLGELAHAQYDSHGDHENFTRKAIVGLNYCRRRLVHLESFLRATRIKSYKDIQILSRGPRGWISDYARSYSIHEVESLSREIGRETLRMYWRVIEAKAASGELDDSTADQIGRRLFADPMLTGESCEQQYASRLRAIRLIQDLPGARRLTRDFATKNLRRRTDPSYVAFLDEIARIPNENVRAGVQDARKELEKLLARQKAQVQNSRIKPRPTDQGQTDVLLRKLPFGGRRLVACGEGVDAAWGWKSFQLMKERCKLKSIYSTKERFFNFLDGVYDGKYVWVPVLRGNPKEQPKPLMLAVDPETEKIWEFTASDGLPPGWAFVAPLEAGKVCAAGGFGRSWCAILRLDERGSKSVEVFHEARRQHDVSRDRNDEAVDPKMAFHPRFMVVLTDERDSLNRRVLVGRLLRNVAGHPLLIDAEKKEVTVVADRLSRSAREQGCVTSHKGALYWVADGRHSLCYRMGFPDFKITEVAKNAIPEPYPGKLNVLFHEGKIHLVGRNWWTSDKVSGPFARKLVRVIVLNAPTGARHASEVPGKPYLRRFSKSNHYGLVLVAPPEGVFQVEFVDHPNKPIPATQPALALPKSQSSNEENLVPRELTQQQPGSKDDRPPMVECPDTPIGRASRALLLEHREQAIKHLQKAMESGMAPDAVRKMIRKLSAQKQPASMPVSAGEVGEKNE